MAVWPILTLVSLLKAGMMRLWISLLTSFLLL
uniref:Uncharacterized protein n=1 Tax=Anguilla anguilla TaxID=7936 RepID=A0A0E9VA45_ANGAN